VSRETRAVRSEFNVWQSFTTRWADNDAYGHVNNTVFYQWADSAVNGWLVGQDLLDIESGDSIALVVETRCSYFAPLTFPEPIDIGLAVAHLGRSSVRYRIGVFVVGTEQAAAQGEFVHVLVDRTSRRPVEMPQSWRRALESIS
jgi:acyl-CoA thioester hydrolase